jgi:hypothetical protein
VSVPAAVWSLIGSFSESSSYVHEHRAGGSYVFEVVTGLLAGDTSLAPHGHTVRLRVEA